MGEGVEWRRARNLTLLLIVGLVIGIVTGNGWSFVVNQPQPSLLKTELTALDILVGGRVLCEKGQYVGGATILCEGAETKTLFDGSYTFDGLALGPHIVEIAMEGYKIQKIRIEMEEREEAVINFHLELEVGDAKISGYVLDEVTREPARTSGSVYMYRPTCNRNTPIDPETGYFEFTHLPPGTYTLWTSNLEYNDEKKTVTVKEDGDRREDFFISKADIEPPLG